MKNGSMDEKNRPIINTSGMLFDAVSVLLFGLIRI